mmetsp:Transcript_71180/g.123517  ORF Transcript_71180/g.123517 Transcript_71180/m.123517 type:complete len:419 (-) Transcript_71180:116-1372(-)
MHHQKPSDVAKDTLQILRNARYTHGGSPVVLDRVRLANSTRKSTMYSDGRELPSLLVNDSGAEQSPRVVLFEGSSFEAACWALSEDPVCSPAVLDFASDSEPGGGYKGNQQSTQEESLCRRSNLALGLEALSDKYPIPALGAAYVPDVCVFRGDEPEGYPLWSQPVWMGGVIAAALRCVDTGGESLDPKQAAFVRSKIDGVLSIARHHRHNVLVLGAWGCGAFGNTASCIAEVFREAIHGPHALGLSTVIFPLVRKENSQAFSAVWHDALRVPRSCAAAEPPSRSEKMAFEELTCELSVLVNERCVWEAALEAAEIPNSEADLRTNLCNLGRALANSVLVAAEATLPEYHEELAAVRAALANRERVTSGDARTVESIPEVAAALASLDNAVKLKVMDHARENGWLKKGHRDRTGTELK